MRAADGQAGNMEYVQAVLWSTMECSIWVDAAGGHYRI